MWAVAYQSEPGFGIGQQDRLEAFDFFLGREAPDIEEQWVLWVALGEAGAHLRGTAVALESISVDASGPEA